MKIEQKYRKWFLRRVSRSPLMDETKKAQKKEIARPR